MTAISAILLLAALANLGMAAAMFVRRHSRRLHFAFAFLVACTGAWTLANFVISLLPSPTVLEHVGRLSFAIAALVAYGCLLFSWVFPATPRRPPPPARVAATAFAALVMTILSLTPLIQRSIVWRGNQPNPEFGMLYPLYVVYMLGFTCWGIVNIVRSRLAIPDGRERLQVDYCLAGIGFSFIPAFFCNFALPQLTDRSEFFLLGAASPLVWTSLTFYAICRHRLMDIGIVLRNLLIHLLAAGALLLAMLLPWVLLVCFDDRGRQDGGLLLVIVVAALVAVEFPHFHRRLKHWVDHNVFKGRYDHQSALVLFGEQLMHAHGWHQLVATASRLIPVIVQARHLAVFLRDEDQDGYHLASRPPPGPDPPDSLLPTTHPLVERVVGTLQPVDRFELLYGSDPQTTDSAAATTMEAWKAILALPLVSQETVVGLLLVGEKLHDNAYSPADLDLLEALAAQLAVALDNARLYEQVVKSERLYRTMLGHMRQAVVAVDAKLRITHLNPTAATLFGLDETVSRQDAPSTLPPPLGELLRETLKQGRNLPPQETIVHLASDATFPGECETSILRQSHDQVFGAMLVCQDLTERKRFEEHIRRMDRLASVGTLAAGIAHEIKNPLVSIKTFVQLLPERYQDEEFRNGFGSVVGSEVARINRLIHDLLNFARPAARRNSPVDLHDLLSRVATLLNSEMKMANIDFSLDCQANPPAIVGDQEQLYQVFLNLLQNAIQAIDGQRRQITVAVHHPPATHPGQPPSVQVVIADSGRGIAEDDLPRIFDPFFSKREGGSGLGLAICHGILQHHQARVDVQSTIGQGTTFTITLPVDGAT